MFVVVKARKNPLLGVVALCTRMRTSLHTSVMLRINCPIHISLFSPHAYPKYLHQPSSPHMWCIYAGRRRHLHAGNLLMSGTLLKTSQDSRIPGFDVLFKNSNLCCLSVLECILNMHVVQVSYYFPPCSCTCIFALCFLMFLLCPLRGAFQPKPNWIHIFILLHITSQMLK